MSAFTQEIDSLLGTHLTDTTNTVNATQQALNTLNPEIQAFNKNLPMIMLTAFIAVFAACFLALKVHDKI